MMSYWNQTDTAGLEELHLFGNQSTGFCRHTEKGQWYCYMVLVLSALALPLGLLGNLAVLLNHACFRPAPSPSSVFLLNLALCDSAWILTLPSTLYFTFQTEHIAGVRSLCRFKKVSFNVNVYGSILFLTLVSFDRYVAAVLPVASLRWWGMRKAKLCSACAWVVLVLSAIPDLFLPFGDRRRETVTVCSDHVEGPPVYVNTSVLIRTALGFLLPFGVMLAFYVRTVRVLRRLPKARAGGKPLRLLTAAIVVFAISFAPYHIMVVTLVALRTRDLVTPSNSSVLSASLELCEALCTVSSCLDPLLYIVAGQQLQRRLVTLKRDGRRRRCCRASRRVGVTGG